MKKKAKPESLSTAARQCALCEDGKQRSNTDEIYEQARAYWKRVREGIRASPQRHPELNDVCLKVMGYYIIETFVHAVIVREIKLTITDAEVIKNDVFRVMPPEYNIAS